MASFHKRPSRHLLPLPSLIFNKSRNDFTAPALSTLNEDPDEVFTALPPPAEEPSPDPKSRPQEPTKSVWRRAWHWLTKLNCSSPKTHEEPAPRLVISAPFDFQHVGGLGSDNFGNDIKYQRLGRGQQRHNDYRRRHVMVRESVVSTDSAWTDIVE